MLKLAENLKLPLDAVTRTFGVLAVRGAGKSNTAAVMAEEMFANKLPFVAVDPVGSWYGLRSSEDGTAPGLPIPIFGGKHGDLPLERGAGELVADTVVDQRLSCVLDLSEFDSEAAKKQFLLGFATRLYRRNEDPLHLFLEEADDYIPQKPMRDEAHLLRAFENIVRRGRARGLGITLITQRSAAISKMVLTQVETLFAMRTTGPQDLAAIESWIKYHAVSRDVLATLAGLEDGEAWVWSPHFLKTLTRVQIRRRRTFDSGATPKNVKATQAKPVATLADVDLAQLQKRMAATIEKAKADDPRELRKRIAGLEQQLESKVPSWIHVAPEKPVLTDADRKLLEGVSARFAELSQTLRDHGANQLEIVTRAATKEIEIAAKSFIGQTAAAADAAITKVGGSGLLKVLEKLETVPPPPTHPARGQGSGVRPDARTVRPAPAAVNGSGAMPSGERKILTALAQYPDGRTKNQIAILTGYAVNGGGFNNYLSSLRTKGWIAGAGDDIQITPQGVTALGEYDPLPVGEALLRHWLGQLGRAERSILDVLASRHPAAVEKDALGAMTGYAPDGGGFNNALSRLRTLELIEGRGSLKASDALFE